MSNHVVVDGSNIATEGRSMPSLQQLNDAVLAFMEEHPDALITVVVDATFGHRIDPREVPEFDAAIANNELVAPPAGAIGRGDAFVLSIAHKVRARILTNDSYQEFHADYPWLFDEGRLIGGKPVPHIGWVFVNRLPVRGPISRKATSEARRRKKPEAVATNTAIVGSPDASQPMPVPKAPPPRVSRRPAPAADAAPQVAEAVAATAAAPEAAPTGKRRRGRGGAAPAAAVETVASPTPAGEQQQRSSNHGPVNELMPYLDFVARHPVGTSVSAVVDHYSSHGAYVRIDDVKAYIPLRLMADPAPRSARELLKIGETHVFVVVSYVPDKRSIDLALPGMAGVAAPAADAPVAPVKKAAGRKAASKKGAEKATPAEVETTALAATPATRKAATKKAVAKKAVSERPAASKAPVAEAAATATASKKAAATPVKAAAAKKAPAKKAAPAKAVAKKAAPVKAAPKKAAAEPASAAPVAKKATTKKVAAK
ncbi:MAG: hypothetical protein RJB65_948, partial [Actinomycetota bacterium]